MGGNSHFMMWDKFIVKYNQFNEGGKFTVIGQQFQVLDEVNLDVAGLFSALEISSPTNSTFVGMKLRFQGLKLEQYLQHT